MNKYIYIVVLPLWKYNLSVYFHCVKKYIKNCATTELVLLPTFELGSKSLLPQKKKNF